MKRKQQEMKTYKAELWKDNRFKIFEAETDGEAYMIANNLVEDNSDDFVDEIWEVDNDYNNIRKIF